MGIPRTQYLSWNYLQKIKYCVPGSQRGVVSKCSFKIQSRNLKRSKTAREVPTSVLASLVLQIFFDQLKNQARMTLYQRILQWGTGARRPIFIPGRRLYPADGREAAVPTDRAAHGGRTPDTPLPYHPPRGLLPGTAGPARARCGD